MPDGVLTRYGFLVTTTMGSSIITQCFIQILLKNACQKDNNSVAP